MATLPQHNYPNPQERKSLVEKLAEACNAVGGVEKKGRNEFQRYDYVKAADVAKAIRHELFKRGIVVIVDEKAWSVDRMIVTNSGAEIPLMILRGEVTFRDDKETLGPIGAFATAFDSGDKAIYKAKTGLLKYALRGIGLIPDERDDPEFDEAVDAETDPKVITGGKPSKGKNPRIKEYQVRAWDSAIHKSGKTAEQVATYLRVRWSAATVGELTPEDFKEAIKWPLGTEPMAETLATSVAAKKKAQPIARVLDRPVTDELAGD